MNRALKLAKKGLFTTGENPRVACVLVKNGIIVGTGCHQRVGEPHAEAFALKEAGEKAEGATAYVTLEPCSHVGKNPSCADALIKAGIKKVVVCNHDPNPLVAGKGIAKLETAGIKVKQNVKAKKGLKLNRGFFHRMQTGLPFVRRKTNSTPPSKLHYWRACSNAILIDVDTLLKNHSNFKVQPNKLPKKYRKFAHDLDTNQPMLVILDLKLEIDLNAIMLKRTSGRCIIMTHSKNLQKIQILKDKSIEVVVISNTTNHKNLLPIFEWLGDQKINNLLVEFNPHQ